MIIALITYCAVILLKVISGYQGTLLRVTMILKRCLFEEFRGFVRKIHCKYDKSSKGRRRLDHEKVYEAVVKQVEENDLELLNDLCYDPVIL